ncbi:MAG: T9SS type A sorting domain-containing protein [Bacteroidetes bacterium]|nr:T9SS type A sorting domain-containing protein [Bacteroidota bacterium]
MRTTIYLLLLTLFCSVNGMQAQNLKSYIMFANHTNMELQADSRVTGASDMVEFRQTRIAPWMTPMDHDVGIYVTVVLLDILFDIYTNHIRHKWLARCERFSFLGNKDHAVEIDIQHEGDLLFTILYNFRDDAFDIFNPTTYNVRYPDGSVDVAQPYSLANEQYNSPHAASRQITVDGMDYKLIYGTFREDLDPTGDVLFSLSEAEPVSFHMEPDPADLDDPTILNMLTYNPGILMPLNANDQEEKERSAVFHEAMPKNMDIIVFQEFFQPYYSKQIMDSLAQWYPYQTNILNPDVSIPLLQLSGGVAIVSKFPILEEDDFSFQTDGSSSVGGLDQQADKGVKYAKIDKHGQIVHVFGTHTYGDESDNFDMGGWIQEKLQPNRNDIVVMGGDMNTRAYSGQYDRMADTLNIVEPTYKTLTHDQFNLKATVWNVNHFISVSRTNGSIDFLFANNNFKVPEYSYNDVQAYRLHNLNRNFWGIFDLGDHQPVYARFEFPELTVDYADTDVCPGDIMELSVQTTLTEYEVEWYQGETLLEGENGLSLFRQIEDTDDFGQYRCEMIYHYLPDLDVNASAPAHYGIYTVPAPVEGRLIREFDVQADPENCVILSVLDDLSEAGIVIFPNPVTDRLTIRSTRKITNGISIFDASGKQLMDTDLNQELNVNTSGWSKGAYTIVFNQGDDTQMHYNFVKQ